MNHRYFIMKRTIPIWRGNLVEAKTIYHNKDHSTRGAFGIDSPFQKHPYGQDPRLVIDLPPSFPTPDWLCVNTAFWLFSERVVDILISFDVDCEYFDVSWFEKSKADRSKKYKIVHFIGKEEDVLDAKASEFLRIPNIHVERGTVKKFVIKYGNFKENPLIECNKTCLYLIREDLMNTLLEAKVSGFRFINPSDFCSDSRKD